MSTSEHDHKQPGVEAGFNSAKAIVDAAAEAGLAPALADQDPPSQRTMYGYQDSLMVSPSGDDSHIDDDDIDWLTGERIHRREVDLGPELPKPVLEMLETQGFVKTTPNFLDIAADETRTDVLRYADIDELLNRRKPDQGTVREISEHEALQQLKQYLEAFMARYHSDRDDFGGYDFAKVAPSMHEKLAYIGPKEYTEAAAAFGESWRQYLDGDPNRQLVVLANLAEFYRDTVTKKSDVYVLDTILSTFTDEELERYSGRLFTDTSFLTADPEHVKIVLTDDLALSGAQMRDRFDHLQQQPELQPYLPSVEINLMAASPSVIQWGITMEYGRGGHNIPVKAYYQSREASDASYQQHDTHITLWTTPVDYGFAKDLETMSNVAKRRVSQEPDWAACERLPALANIIPPYNNPRRIAMREDGSLYRIQGEVLRSPELEQSRADAVLDRRRWEIEHSPLLSELGEAERAEAIRDTQELYELSREVVAPVITDFADYLLTVAGDRQIICAGRDGIGTCIAADVLKSKFPYTSQDPEQLIYAYLSRNVVNFTEPKKLARYLTELGVHNLNDSVLLGDIGVYGTSIPNLRYTLPAVDPRYLISRNPNIPGYADGQNQHMASLEAEIAGNPAIHFLEDTFSGPIPSPYSLVERDGRLQPDTIDATHFYDAATALKREFALQAIEDYAEQLRLRPSQVDADAHIQSLDVLLANPAAYEHLMVHHET